MLEGCDALASASLLDFESSADLEAEALASLSDFDLDSDSELTLLAEAESNCSAVNTIFVSLILKAAPCAGVEPMT